MEEAATLVLRSPPAAPARARRSSRPHGARHLALVVAAALGLTLIVQLLPLRQRDGHLRLAVLEIEIEGHQRQAFTFHGANEASNLAPVQEQLAGARGLVIPDV